MHLFLVFTLVFSLVLVFSQLGFRLLARHAAVWWLIAALGLALILLPYLSKETPSWPVGATFFILWGCFSILLYFLLRHGVQLTRLHRSFREMITSEVAAEFDRERNVSPSSECPVRALVVLPCYNEEASLAGMIPRMKALVPPSLFCIDHCFINDGSKDGSEAMLSHLDPGHFASHPVNLGVSGVLLTGFKIAQRAGFDYVIQCDSDGQHPVECIPALLENAYRRRLDLLIGSRFSDTQDPALSLHNQKTRCEGISTIRKAGSRFIRWVLKNFSNENPVTDPTSGFRVYSEKAFRFLIGRMPEEYPEPESIALLASEGMRIGEVRVSMPKRVHGASSLRGIKPLQYMVKVTSALIGLRLRLFLKNF